MFPNWLKIPGVQVLILLSTYLLVSNFIPYTLQQGLYSTSLLIKDCLMWVMPVMIIFFVAHSVMSFEKSAPVFVCALVVFELISNFSSVWYAYFAGLSVIPKASFYQQTVEQTFLPLWRLSIKPFSWWTADKGFLAGLFIGLVGVLWPRKFVFQFLEFGKNLAQQILIKIFSRLIPLFILGFIVYMDNTKVLERIQTQYAMITLYLFGVLIIYLCVLFLISAQFNFKNMWVHFKNLMPAGAVAITSGSSLASMPWTIQGASKNLKYPHLAQAIIPATTNIQQIGDCIINAFLCMVIYKSFYGVFPDLTKWVFFSFAFVIARFATTAIMGGAIFVMLPIYVKYLQFTPEMIGIIVGLNGLLDPIVTSSNVLANGALCRIFEQVWIKLNSILPEKFKAPLDAPGKFMQSSGTKDGADLKVSPKKAS